MTTDFGWKIIYLEDESELFAEVNRLVSIIFMFSLGISALIICVALLLTRSIVRPLEQLVATPGPWTRAIWIRPWTAGFSTANWNSCMKSRPHA